MILAMLADAGIPMIVVQWPLMFAALIPVIVIEALLIRRWIELSYRDAFFGITIANCLSTLAGFPLAWLVMFALEMGVMLPMALAADKWHWHFFDSPFFQIISFPLTVAWLGPSEWAGNWLVPLAAALLLIPSFYVSVWLENFVCRKTWPDIDVKIIRRGVYRANLVSYVMLFVLACGWAGLEFCLEKR